MYELAADAAFAYDTANRLFHTRTTKSDQAKLEDTRWEFDVLWWFYEGH